MIERNAWKRGLTPLDKGELLNRFRTPQLQTPKVWKSWRKKAMRSKRMSYTVSKMRDDPDVAEVITHEIPEDDVPGEYLDSDDHLA